MHAVLLQAEDVHLAAVGAQLALVVAARGAQKEGALVVGVELDNNNSSSTADCCVSSAAATRDASSLVAA